MNIQSFFGATAERPLDISLASNKELAERIVSHSLSQTPTPLEVAIPSAIHFVWLGPNDMTNDMTACVQSWKEKHPGWEICIWRDEDIAQQNWINQEALNYAMRCGRYGMASDIVRLEILWRRGGFYVDIDYICLADVNELASCCGFICGASNTGCVEINNGIIGSRPQYPLLRSMVEKIQSWFHKVYQPVQHMSAYLDPASRQHLEMATSPSKMDIILNTGPGLITSSVGEVLYSGSGSNADLLVLPYHVFHPIPNLARHELRLDDPSWIQKYTHTGTKAAHLWMCSWT